jgi:hypothetical protein
MHCVAIELPILAHAAVCTKRDSGREGGGRLLQKQLHDDDSTRAQGCSCAHLPGNAISSEAHPGFTSKNLPWWNALYSKLGQV